MLFGIIMIIIGLPALVLFLWGGIAGVMEGEGEGGMFYLAIMFGLLPLFLGMRRFIQLRQLKRYQEEP